MSDTVQKIKDKLSIVDVVAPYVKLTKSGKYYKGLSPFNKEKTPSFFVNVERGSYYCFSSSQGGDMFTFTEKMEGVDFKGALKLLAQKAGVDIVYDGNRTGDKGKLDRLREIMQEAERYFISQLSLSSEAYAYALSRGLIKETVSAWKLGYAPDGWRNVLEALGTKGYSVSELQAVGLIKEADEKRGTFYDRFRNRLMFPIADSAGRTVAFTGRALTKDDLAKYLNSPETELFHKSSVLFGMDKAKDAIRTRGFAILVEGQFDLILLHQIGFTNTIALSGTVLSPQHLTLIRRYADNLMLCLDADRAGLVASAKNAHAALLAGMRVKAVRLPLGKDPADLCVETPQDMKRRISESESIVEFFLSILSSSEKDPHRLVVSVERIVLPLINAITSPLEREHFVGIVARALATTPEAVRASLGKVAPVPHDKDISEGKETELEKPQTALEKRAEFLRAIILSYPDTALAKRVESEYARIIGLSEDKQDTTPAGTPPESVIFSAGLALGESPNEEAADDLLRAFEQSALTEELAQATHRLRIAEASKDDAAITTALEVCKEISKRLAAFS